MPTITVKHYNDTQWSDSLDQKVYAGKDTARYIRWSAFGNTTNQGTHFVEIQAFDQDNTNRLLNVVGTVAVGQPFGPTPINVVTDGLIQSESFFEVSSVIPPVLQWDMGQVYNLKEIKFWHYYPDTRSYRDVMIQVSDDGVNWTTVFSKDIEPATAAGTSIKLLGWQPWEALRYDGTNWVALN